MRYEEGHIRRKLAEELVKGLTPEMSVLRGPENDSLSIEYTSSLVVMSREDLTKMTSALRDALAVARGGLKDVTLRKVEASFMRWRCFRWAMG